MHSLFLAAVLALTMLNPVPPANPVDRCKAIVVRRHLGTPVVRVENGKCQMFMRTLDRNGGMWLPIEK